MINDVINVTDTTQEEDEHALDTVAYFCPQCDSMLIQNQACVYTCPCGLKWITPDPICVTSSKRHLRPIKEINGKVI